MNENLPISGITTKESALSNLEGKPILILNPGHGNEPYILANAIGATVCRIFEMQGQEPPVLVMPLLYGDNQIKILREEDPNNRWLHLDDTMGKILQTILFREGDFASHVALVNRYYETTEHELNHRFSGTSDTFTAKKVGGEEVLLSPRNIIGAIETGNKISIITPYRYFAFPALLSEILTESMDANLGFPESDMTELIKKMLKVETAYSQVFIPWVNSLSSQYATLDDQPAGRQRIYTPPMKPPIAKKEFGIQPGVYMMLSGTGSDLQSIKPLIAACGGMGLNIYTPPWAAIEGTTAMSPTVMSDPNIIAIMGRSGWGTGWQAMQLSKPWLVAPYQPGDDPEIFFNNQSIEALNLGKVLRSGIDSNELFGQIASITPGISMLNEAIKLKFGTNNGIDFIAQKIFNDLTEKK